MTKTQCVFLNQKCCCFLKGGMVILVKKGHFVGLQVGGHVPQRKK